MTPRIDPSVSFVGVSKLRELNAEFLRRLDKTLVVQHKDQPLAVIMPYQTFLAFQKPLGRG